VARLAQSLKSAMLAEFASAFVLGMKYFFKPKATVNYPYEKGPVSPRFRGEHALRRYRNLPGAGDHHRSRSAPQ